MERKANNRRKIHGRLKALLIAGITAFYPTVTNTLSKPLTVYAVTPEKERFTDLKDSVWSMTEEIMPELKKNHKKKNFAFSPLSLYTALTVLNEGTGGNTKDELTRFLKVKEGKNYGEEVKELADAYGEKSNDTDYTSLINGIFIDRNFKVKDEFLEKAKKYGTEVKNTDFSDEEGTRNFFKGWIKEKTEGMLEFSPGFSRDTSLMLLNVLNLKGKWEESFKERPDMDFNTLEKTSLKVKAMGKGKYKGEYFKGSNFEGYKEYLKGAGAVYFILPEDGVKPHEITELSKISEIKGTEEKMNITMPEVTVKTDGLKIDSAMKTLGYKELFSEGADLSGIAEKILVSAINQTSKVEINREEIKGSSVTSVEIMPTAAPEKPEKIIELIYDRPYIVVIENEGVPLFIMYVIDPSEV